VQHPKARDSVTNVGRNVVVVVVVAVAVVVVFVVVVFDGFLKLVFEAKVD
jgi:hypothetical protein